MLATPDVPTVQSPDLFASLGDFPVKLDLSPAALLVVLLLVGLFFAAMSVIMVYHWRRFPYEKEVFDYVEHWYFRVSWLFMIGSLFFIWLAI